MTTASEDDERFRSAYQTHARAILGYAARRMGSIDVASDVLADTMLVAWRRIDDMPGEPETRLWLYGVARNVVANHRRGHVRQARLGARLRQQLTRSTDALEVADPHLATFVRQALDRLSGIEREVILLTAAEALTPGEIATVLEMNASTVRTHLQRARDKLRDDFVGHGLTTRDLASHAAGDEMLRRQRPTGHEPDRTQIAFGSQPAQETPR